MTKVWIPLQKWAEANSFIKYRLERKGSLIAVKIKNRYSSIRVPVSFFEDNKVIRTILTLRKLCQEIELMNPIEARNHLKISRNPYKSLIRIPSEPDVEGAEINDQKEAQK